MKTKRRPAIQVFDDEWVTISWNGQHEECCHCNARHRVDYRVVNGKLQFRARLLPKRRARQ